MLVNIGPSGIRLNVPILWYDYPQLLYLLSSILSNLPLHFFLFIGH